MSCPLPATTGRTVGGATLSLLVLISDVPSRVFDHVTINRSYLQWQRILPFRCHTNTCSMLQSRILFLLLARRQHRTDREADRRTDKAQCLLVPHEEEAHSGGFTVIAIFTSNHKCIARRVETIRLCLSAPLSIDGYVTVQRHPLSIAS